MAHTPSIKEGAVPPTWDLGDFGFNRVHAFVMTTNAPSIALLERAGFTREGTLRQFRIARDTPRDFHLYAFLKQDFGK